MTEFLRDIVNFQNCPITDKTYIQQCATKLRSDSILTLESFLFTDVVEELVREAEQQKDEAFFTSSTHNVYLTEKDDSLGINHVFNRQVRSSKGCITTDQVIKSSKLHKLYRSDDFKAFIAAIVGEDSLFEYGDTLSGINVHYAADKQELGWHFDNSSFAITLLLQRPFEGGVFEYVRDLRDAESGDMKFDAVENVLDGKTPVQKININPGTLVLFRGRDSMHRVTPVSGSITRIMVVLAYNNKPNIPLSETARMTFFGRLV